MKPSSKNEVMNGIVNAYIAQKALDKANNTHYADTWKILNGADDEIDASLTFDLSEGEWDSVKTYLKANNIAFALCLVSYKDGHSQNSFVWYDDQHIYAVEMNEIGSVTFHIIDNVNKEIVKPTDETSSSILKMLLALENGGANGGGGEVTTKQVFKGGVDILDKPLNVESKATFGSDAEVDGKLTINSAKDLVTKDGTSIGGETFYDIGDIEFNKEKTLTKEQGEAIYNNGNPLGIKCTAGGFDWHFVNNGTKAVSGGTQYFPYNVIGPVVFGPMYVGVQFNKNNDNYTVQFFEESMPTSLSIDGNKKISLIADLFGEIYINTVNGTPIIQENISQDIKVQEPLVSGTNIKTINNESLLGSGNIDVGDKYITETDKMLKITAKSPIDGFSIDDGGNVLFSFVKNYKQYSSLFRTTLGIADEDGNSYVLFMDVDENDEHDASLHLYMNLPYGLGINVTIPAAAEGTIALTKDLDPLKTDIAKKQATLYRHTITIYEGNTKDKNSICFTAYTPINTPIDSIQDLTASADGSNKLANTDLECFGVSGTADALVFYNKIHVGTSISNTTLQKVTGGSATLASVYATYTMTDDVTLN